MIPPEVSSLLAQLSSEPENHALWAVVADVFIDAGDPRGAFIATLLKQRASGRPFNSLTHNKMVKLFRRHRTAWLGPLASVVVRSDQSRVAQSDVPFDVSVAGDSVETELWDRGFPVHLACRLSGTTRDALEWRTVQSLVLVRPDDSQAWPTELEAQVTPSLVAVLVHPDEAEWKARVGSYLEKIGRASLLTTRLPFMRERDFDL